MVKMAIQKVKVIEPVKLQTDEYYRKSKFAFWVYVTQACLDALLLIYTLAMFFINL